MSQSVTIVYDGEVFRPETPVDIEPNTRFVLPLDPLDDSDMDEASKEGFEIIRSLIGKAPGPKDWSTQLDHYLYGLPKDEEQTKNAE